ncbi:hypothetical protein [Bradyrhizobium sp. OK095]|uniref:hypothetical protein n=1 Tax=Bradyrhizobium sp. OK095 TaxID=1882760 RepID=UPI000B836E7E|nr:hypothetical protein [Bradyrhizobium sp. OK095]
MTKFAADEFWSLRMFGFCSSVPYERAWNDRRAAALPRLAIALMIAMASTAARSQEAVTLDAQPFSLSPSPVLKMDILGISPGTPYEKAKKILIDEFGATNVLERTTSFHESRREGNVEISVKSTEVVHSLVVNTKAVFDGVEFGNRYTLLTVPTLRENPVYLVHRQTYYSSPSKAPDFATTLVSIQTRYGKAPQTTQRPIVERGRQGTRHFYGWEFLKDSALVPANGGVRMPSLIAVKPFFDTNKTFEDRVECKTGAASGHDSEAFVELDQYEGKLAAITVALSSAELCNLGFEVLRRQMEEALIRASGGVIRPGTQNRTPPRQETIEILVVDPAERRGLPRQRP